MLDVKNVDIMISTKYLIRNLSFTLNKKDKLAIIGEEGNGKSTLLKSLLGICEYATLKGTVDFKGKTVGYLEQSISFSQKVYDYLFVDEWDYYQKINSFYQYLKILSLEDFILNQNVDMLSGGEKVKIGILKLLLEESDILFLDEPTNDLDIETLEWLEDFISKIEKPIIYVSHDETLLSKTANMILHLEQIKKKTECRHILIRSSYDSYIKNRIRGLEHQEQIAKKQNQEYKQKQAKLIQVMQKVEYQQNTISRADPHGAKMLKKKMHALKAQEKRLENTSLTEIPDVEEHIHFFFEKVNIPKNKVILKLHLKELVVENKVLSKNTNLEVIGNTHVCIVGKNGVGKTTLLKKIYEKLNVRNDLKVGYMPQNYDEIFAHYENVLDFVTSKEKEAVTKARMYLGNMNFTRDEMVGNIRNLSNGSKAKLFLTKLVLDECDVLILDEPTRNVSPLSNPVIRKVLKEFNGTIISVSHDRKYIEEVIDELYVLDKNGLKKVEK